jgi:hypothetical protein
MKRRTATPINPTQPIQELQLCVDDLKTELSDLNGVSDEDKALSQDIMRHLRLLWRLVKAKSVSILFHLTAIVYLLKAFGINTELSGPWINQLIQTITDQLIQ